MKSILKVFMLTLFLQGLTICKPLVVKYVPVPPVPIGAGGNVRDFAKLNAGMTNKWASIDIATGILTIGFEYPMQGWWLYYDGSNVFDYPHDFLITLKDRYGQDVDQFATGLYWWPEQVIETIKKCPSLNPSISGKTIDEYDGNILKKKSNRISVQLDAKTADLAAQICICFNTNVLIDPDKFVRPPFSNVICVSTKKNIEKPKVYYWRFIQEESSEKLTSQNVTSGMRAISAAKFEIRFKYEDSNAEESRDQDQIYASRLIHSFLMDTVDVTQADYQMIMGTNPSLFKSGDLASSRPVETVTWFDAVLYCNARSKRDGYDTVYSYTAKKMDSIGCTNLANISYDLAKNGYRLPTEAEWEYACRAGTTTDYYWGNDTSDAIVNQYAWYSGNCSSTMPVAMKQPNAFYLYDMVGNVYQWCNDWYGDIQAGGGEDSTDINNGLTSTKYTRVLRGSCWYTRDVKYLRSAERKKDFPDRNYMNPEYGSGLGFRCVRR